MAIDKWVIETNAEELMTTELNSLVSGTGIVSSVGGTSGVFDNVSAGTADVDGYQYGVFELVLGVPAGSVAWTAGGCVKLWFLHMVDGTNAEDAPPNRTPAVMFQPYATASAQRLAGVRGDNPLLGETVIRLPPGEWKVYAVSAGMGSAFAASGNTIKVRAVSKDVV